MIEIIFLGTSAMAPTKDRNHTSIFIRRFKEYMLFDCGEGTQRQLKIAGISPQKISNIYLSHWHGDHMLGLPGLVQTLGANNYDKTLQIYGPNHTKEKIKTLMETFPFEASIDYEAKDVKEGKVKETEDFVIKAFKLKHSAPCFGYRLEEKDKLRIIKKKLKEKGIEEGPHLNKLLKEKEILYKGKKITTSDICKVKKGKKIGYIADTGLCDNVYKIAKDVDLLICESTYAEEHREKAEEYLHLTGKQAAEIAKASNVKNLILTHFSQRYLNTKEILKEAKEVFENTKAAYDFMKVKVK
jgi:ribonuclease Z